MNEPQYDTTTGWSSETSALGGKRGRRLDRAIAAIATINPAIAAVIPAHVVGCFWKPAENDATFGGNYKPSRYATPTTQQLEALNLNPDQVNQIIWNEQSYVNFLVGGWMIAGNRNTYLSDMYRGEQGRPGIPRYNPDTGGGSFLPGTTVPHKTPEQAAQSFAGFPHPFPFVLAPGQLGHLTPEPLIASIALDHWLCDVWFDLTTDENAARYARNFARAFGVDVDPEPGD